MKTYRIMIDGQNIFGQPVRNDLITVIRVNKSQQVKEMIMELVVC